MANVIPPTTSSTTVLKPVSQPSPSLVAPTTQQNQTRVPVSLPDEVIVTSGPSPSKKGGRRPTFTALDDLILAREVSAAKTHVVGYGEIQKRFADAAVKANLNKRLSQKVTAKIVQDRYKKIQDAFDRRDAADRKLSGVGGEIGELDELLGMMAEAKNDIEMEKKAEVAAQEEKEAKKEQIGRELVAKSLARKRSGSASVEDEVSEGQEGEERREKRRKTKARPGDTMDGELEGFGMALRDADMARIKLKRERLAFERERSEQERVDREKERELRREDREAHNELELEKFKMLMGAFMQAKK